MSYDLETQLMVTFGFDSYLIRYGSIFLLIVGTFGNIVSFIIFLNETLRRSSTFRYLAFLSIMDLLVLYSGLLDLFLIVESKGTFSLRNINPIACRLHTFITYWSQHSSSWILSFVSVDRAVATNCIKFARKFCTPRSAEYVVVIILCFTALFNCHELLFLRLQNVSSDEYSGLASIELSHNSNITLQQSTIALEFTSANTLRNKQTIRPNNSACDNLQSNFLCLKDEKESLMSNTTLHNNSLKTTTTTTTTVATPLQKCAALQNSRYEHFWNLVWEWIDVCLYALIPFTTMSIGTFLIVYRVYYQQRRVFRSRRSATTTASGASPNKAKSLFYLLFTLNLLYFILVSPVVFITTILFRNPNAENAYPRLKAIVYLMQYCNHSLNFIFYGITSPPYRRILCEWFRLLMPYLPRHCQTIVRQRSKSNAVEYNLVNAINRSPDNVKTLDDVHPTNMKPNDRENACRKNETIALIPRV